MIVSQVLLNIAVVSGALPATGVPLPFFSAGGSSLITTLIMSGFIVNISRTSRKPALRKTFSQNQPLQKQVMTRQTFAGEAQHG
jgi:cell division protein FtsW (lipid II flippase)